MFRFFISCFPFLYSIVLLIRLHVVRKSGLRSPQKAVIHIVRVDVGSRDRPCRVVGGGECALAGACARAWGVKRGDSAVRSTQGAVMYVVGGDKICQVRGCRGDAS